MSSTKAGAPGVTRRVLRALIALNVVMGVLIGALLIASVVAEGPVFRALGVGENRSAMLLGMRTIMVLGIASVPLTHAVLAGLLAIVDTVGRGDPFVAANAVRLRKIAWAVLGLELMHLAVGAVAAGVSSGAQPLDLDWSFSFTRWIAVLLLFVLARVFEQGTRMRDDLLGTV
ncbi:MAG: DUF2975 domain-containing protein [Gemmatimonadetes bacterium]|nr:DUF2975 domain-containing protein [Gemmatimonadota bacterium]